jgi:vacuolar-type H+-ATPase subunit I/STV1
VIDGAESDFDTLREVAEWIAADKEGSAALQSTVSSHTESITTLTGDLTELEAKVDEDIANLTTHMSDAATKIAEVDGRLEALEAFEETHTSIDVSDIEGLFAKE